MIVAEPLPQSLLVDARPWSEYAQGHLQGAISLDLAGLCPRLRSEADVLALEACLAEAQARIGVHPEQPVTVYGPPTPSVAKTAFLLTLSGLRVALWFQGWQPWAEERAVPSIPTVEPRVRLCWELLLTAEEARVHPYLLDVREPSEFHAGHIPGARNLPLGSLAFLEPTEAEIGVYCRSGARSSLAFWLLRSRGFRVCNYLGSMLEWEREFPIER
jgi:thiosulfate/3-mercaptopyruvate sulfurtransferase